MNGDVKPMVIDPWSTSEIKNYEKLFSEFGLKSFPDKWKKELKHYLFERGIVIAHRDFDKVMERIRNKKSFIVMTGIASSGKLHFGHKMVIDLVVHLKKLGGKVFFCIADIDAYTTREKIKTMEDAKKFAVENIANALALGLRKKDIYIQSKKEARYYELAFEVAKKFTFSELSAIYGELTPGKLAANYLQYADILHPQLKEYLGPMPSVTPVALDQDPHMRAVRDVCRKLPYNFVLPTSIYIVHQSGLKQGAKMSSSQPETAIFLTDSPEDAKRKIFRAFTGGRGTVEEQRKLGGNPEVCKVYEIYKYHCPDTEFIKEIYSRCKSGKLICGDCKKICAGFITNFLKKHRKKFEKNFEKAKKMVYG